MCNRDYPHLNRFSRSIGIPPEKLVEAFEIEKDFHIQILNETSFQRRQEMYQRVYDAVHHIYGTSSIDISQGPNPMDRLVRFFRRELEGKSILDVGCGTGHFLASVAKQLNHKQLVGLDVSIPSLSERHTQIQFICESIVDFKTDRQFDVVFSNQVLEHIAPADMSMHLSSVRRALMNGGLFIVILPNRLFGPSDITRIIDFSNTGRIMAQGTHLNESTYGDLIPVLESHGFGNFKTVLPIPIIRRFVRNFRMRPSFLVSIEKSSRIIGILRRITYHGRCMGKFGVTLIGTVVPI